MAYPFKIAPSFPTDQVTPLPQPELLNRRRKRSREKDILSCKSQQAALIYLQEEEEKDKVDIKVTLKVAVKVEGKTQEAKQVEGEEKEIPCKVTKVTIPLKVKEKVATSPQDKVREREGSSCGGPTLRGLYYSLCKSINIEICRLKCV